MSPADHPDIDPDLADAVRRAYVRPVDEDTARRHVTAMVAAAAGTNTHPAARPVRPSRLPWRPVLAAATAALVAPVGLAAAGVKLPDAVEEPYRAVGIELPGQERDAGPAPVRTPARRPVGPRAPSAPSARPPATAAPRPAAGRPRNPRSARPGGRRGKRPVNRGQNRRQNQQQPRGRRRSTAPRPQRARPTGSTRANPNAGPKQKRSERKRPK